MLYGTSGQSAGVRPGTLPTPTVQRKEQDVQMSPTSTRTHTKEYQVFDSKEHVDLCTSILSLCLFLLTKLLDTSCVPTDLLEDFISSRSLILSSLYQDPLLQPPMSLWVETLFFLSLKLLAGQMLAHSRGRQRKVFHPQSWTTAECCDSCFGILNRSQRAVSHLGPAVFPQWSTVLAFLCWVSSPTKRTIVVCCIPFCLFMTSL